MRVIMHVDMNSYFATVEQQSNPFLRGKPICVGGKSSQTSSGNSPERTVCAALSIEAKKFGLKSGVSVWEARQTCPQLIVVEADYAKYQFVSRKLFKILESYTPMIEIFSIDEAFLDLTGIIKSYNQAEKIAINIKKRLKDEVGDYLTCSVGISYNKLLAKLASEMKKPDGLTILEKSQLEEVFKSIPIEDLCGIGPGHTRKLHQIGIKTVFDLGSYPVEKLMHFFGLRQGKVLHLMGQGSDNTPVVPYFEYPAEKSFGHSYTLPKNVFKESDAEKVLLKLSEKVGRRMRQAKALGRTVSFYMRFGDFTGVGKQITLPRFIDNGLEIYQVGFKIMHDYHITKPIRAIGISMTNLKNSHDTTKSILPNDIKNENLISALDVINDRYGEFTVFRSSLTKIKNKVQNIPDGRNKRIM